LQINREDAFRIIRLAKIRGLQKTAGDYISEANELSIEITLEILNDNLTHLLEFMNKLKETEKEIMDQAIALWDTKIYSEKDLDDIQFKVAELIQTFEGCERDLSDLYAMEKALQMFHRFCLQLKDDQLTWTQFHKLAEKLVKEIKVNFEEEELPWSIDEILPRFINNITQQRNEMSSTWVNNIKSECTLIFTMKTIDANHLYTKTNNPPPYITEHDMKDLSKINTQIEEHLNKLAIEWLIEKFRELPDSSKEEFLERVKGILEGDHSKKT